MILKFVLVFETPVLHVHCIYQSLQLGTINIAAFATSFKEWKFCQYELDLSGRGINWMKCPVCDTQQHSVHVDGNMKLYRFKSAGV